MRGFDNKRAGAGILSGADQHFAIQQHDATLLQVEGDVDRAFRVEQQLSAVGQLQVFLFAHRRALIGGPLLPGQMLRSYADGPGHQQQAQTREGLAASEAIPASGSLQSLDGEVGRHGAKFSEQRFGPLPGLGMLGTARSPLGNRLVVGRCRGA